MTISVDLSKEKKDIQGYTAQPKISQRKFHGDQRNLYHFATMGNGKLIPNK